MVDMLPEKDRSLTYKLVKKLVLAWDPDFTSVTPEESARIREAEESEYISDMEVDWSNIGKYTG